MGSCPMGQLPILCLNHAFLFSENTTSLFSDFTALLFSGYIWFVHIDNLVVFYRPDEPRILWTVQ